MKSRPGWIPLAGALLFCLWPASSPVEAQAVRFQGCNRCHEGSLSEAGAREYVHSPFTEQQCARCHAEEPLAPRAARERPAVREDHRKIQWLGDSTAQETAHWFVVPGDALKETLVVEARGAAGASQRQELAVPRQSELPAIKDTGRPPTITDLKVLEVERGLFLSATIGWQTDAVASAVVQYGKDDLKKASPRGSRVGRRHQVTLVDLEPARTYRFAAVSEDLFGRRQMSDVFSFSTAQALTASRPSAAGRPPSSGEDFGLSTRLHRVGSDYLVEVVTDSPAAASVGTRGVPRRQAAVPKTAAGAGERGDPHGGLNGKLALSVPVCEGCHKKHVGAASHPVNVYPKKGMVVPAEYKLLNGQITCATCHEPHGSDHEFLSIKARQKDLCVGCHRNMR